MSSTLKVNVILLRHVCTSTLPPKSYCGISICRLKVGFVWVLCIQWVSKYITPLVPQGFRSSSSLDISGLWIEVFSSRSVVLLPRVHNHYLTSSENFKGLTPPQSHIKILPQHFFHDPGLGSATRAKIWCFHTNLQCSYTQNGTITTTIERIKIERWE